MEYAKVHRHIKREECLIFPCSRNLSSMISSNKRIFTCCFLHFFANAHNNTVSIINPIANKHIIQISIFSLPPYFSTLYFFFLPTFLPILCAEFRHILFLGNKKRASYEPFHYDHLINEWKHFQLSFPLLPL